MVWGRYYEKNMILYFIWLNLGLRAPAFNMQTMSTEHLLWSEMILMSAANLIKGHSEGGWLNILNKNVAIFSNSSIWLQVLCWPNWYLVITPINTDSENIWIIIIIKGGVN